MVGVPANRPRYMELNLVEEAERSGDLVSDAFRWMKVARIETEQYLAAGSIGQIKAVRSHRIAFRANPEELAFNRNLVMIADGCGDDLVERFHESLARREAIRRQVLIPIGNPDIHDSGSTELTTKVVADAPARQAMLDPEAPYLRIGMAESS